jgi:hypothetical protein
VFVPGHFCAMGVAFDVLSYAEFNGVEGKVMSRYTKVRKSINFAVII